MTIELHRRSLRKSRRQENEPRRRRNLSTRLGIEALALLHDEQPMAYQKVKEKLTWTEALLTARERSEVERWLGQAHRLTQKYELRVPQTEQLARRF